MCDAKRDIYIYVDKTRCVDTIGKNKRHISVYIEHIPELYVCMYVCMYEYIYIY